jgi:hypothetical protein
MLSRVPSRTGLGHELCEPPRDGKRAGCSVKAYFVNKTGRGPCLSPRPPAHLRQDGKRSKLYGVLLYVKAAARLRCHYQERAPRFPQDSQPACFEAAGRHVLVTQWTMGFLTGGTAKFYTVPLGPKKMCRCLGSQIAIWKLAEGTCGCNVSCHQALPGHQPCGLAV